MDRFVATKRVRFDRCYGIGEIIPGAVIDPRSVKRLTETGKIAPAPKPGPLTGGSQEETMAFLEDILGIDHGEDLPPDLEARAETCKGAIAELKALVNLRDYSPEEDDDIDTTYNTMGDHPMDGKIVPPYSDETPRNAPVGNTPAAPENAQDAPVGDQTTQANVQTVSLTKNDGECDCTDKSGYPDATCHVCGKVCGSKAGLTAHIKAEHPETTE
jgi:hypothetical protein